MIRPKLLKLMRVVQESYLRKHSLIIFYLKFGSRHDHLFWFNAQLLFLKRPSKWFSLR